MKKLLTLFAFVLVTFTGNAQSCPDNHHPHMIDLELPSGTMWACCNVDASQPEGYGGYYAWGEIETKTGYDWDTYKHCNSTPESCHNLGSSISGTQYDVAHVKWGGSWQMPTLDQIIELKDKCKHVWTTQNGVAGRKFIGSNGASIFLPAAGYCAGYRLECGGNYGDYWSGEKESNHFACILNFTRHGAGWESHAIDRCEGRTVRPVSSKTKNRS